MMARPTAAAPVAKDDQLMLARDGSDRVEPAKGMTAITIGIAHESGSIDEEFGAFIADVCRQYLSAEDNARLDRTIDVSRDMCRHGFELDPARVRATVEDNARLRALIKAAEFADNTNGSAFCPWCDAEAAEGQRGHIDCPAFTPEGEVR